MFIVQIAGHLGKDPETRFTPDGQKVTNFTVAVNQRKGKEDMTYWFNVTIWGDRFDKMLPHLKKGSGILVMGKGSTRHYKDKEGREQISLEVTAEILQFNPFGKSDRPDGRMAAPGVTQQYGASQPGYAQEEQGQAAYHSSYSKPTPAYNAPSASGQGPDNSLDDDLPF